MSAGRTQRKGNPSCKLPLIPRGGRIYSACHQITWPHPQVAEAQFEVTLRNHHPHWPGSFTVPSPTLVVVVWRHCVHMWFCLPAPWSRPQDLQEPCGAASLPLAVSPSHPTHPRQRPSTENHGGRTSVPVHCKPERECCTWRLSPFLQPYGFSLSFSRLKL